VSHSFVVCPSCRRHAFASERRCPFCATALHAPARPGVGAALALSTTLLAGACDRDAASPATHPPPSDPAPVAQTPPPRVTPAPAAPDAAAEAPAVDASAPPPDRADAPDAAGPRRSTTRRAPRRPRPQERPGMDYGVMGGLGLEKGSSDDPSDPGDTSRE